MPKDLTPKQKRFCEEFIKDCNATQAYLRAGYRASTDIARREGYKLLTKPDIQAYIQQLQRARSSRTEIDADRVFTELAKIAFSDIKNVFELTEEGLVLKPLDQMSDEVSGAIESLDLGATTKVKLHSKMSALDRLIKLLGMDKEAAIKAVIAMGYGVSDPRTGEKVTIEDQNAEESGTERV